ncbi:MAG: hypothetical protein KC503_35830 [Myxococcales bacterium]|nr:hypothetical protein [Myxococcales bacterium]
MRFAAILSLLAAAFGCAACANTRPRRRAPHVARARAYLSTPQAQIDHDFDHCWRALAWKTCAATDLACRARTHAAYWRVASDKRVQWLIAHGCPRDVISPQLSCDPPPSYPWEDRPDASARAAAERCCRR